MFNLPQTDNEHDEQDSNSSKLDVHMINFGKPRPELSEFWADFKRLANTFIKTGN